MGATGAPGDETLPAGYEQAYTNPDYPDYSYIAPDNTVDASTAVLPDNTWIFLEQHHEVGNNDVVLNLAQAIITGKITSVHDDPVNYPQYNYTCNTKYIRRWRLPDAKALLEQDANGEITLSAEDKAELIAAIADGEAVISATIADEAKTKAAEERLNNILIKLGKMNAPEEESKFDSAFKSITKGLSYFLLETLGGGSLFDKIFR